MERIKYESLEKEISVYSKEEEKEETGLVRLEPNKQKELCDDVSRNNCIR